MTSTLIRTPDVSLRRGGVYASPPSSAGSTTNPGPLGSSSQAFRNRSRPARMIARIESPVRVVDDDRDADLHVDLDDELVVTWRHRVAGADHAHGPFALRQVEDPHLVRDLFDGLRARAFEHALVVGPNGDDACVAVGLDGVVVIRHA